MKLISGLFNPDFIANDKKHKELMERLEKGRITRDSYGNLVSLFSENEKCFLFCCSFCLDFAVGFYSFKVLMV